MKQRRIWLLWVGLLFLASTAFSQSHFITAGQTQGMIVTQFIPDSVLIIGNPPHFQIAYALDMDHDGVSEIKYHYKDDLSPGSGEFYIALESLLSNIEFYTFADSGWGGCGYMNILSPKDNGDTLFNYQTGWVDSISFFSYEGQMPTHCYYPNSAIQTDSMFFVIGRKVTIADTLMFYLGFHNSSTVLKSFAIEGHDTTYIISAITGDENPTTFTLFPNPVTDKIWVEVEQGMVGADLKIYDVSGSLVKQLMVEALQFGVDVGDIGKGIYLITFEHKGVLARGKLVKE